MIIKEHTRNQKRMYRIHKQEEKIHNLELMLGSKNQEIENLNKYNEHLEKAINSVEDILLMKINNINKAIEHIEKKYTNEDGSIWHDGIKEIYEILKEHNNE